jgi:hypothetical protein
VVARVPVLFAIWLLVTWQIAPGSYSKWVIPEGYGILEFSQFVTMLAALFIAVRLLLGLSCTGARSFSP